MARKHTNGSGKRRTITYGSYSFRTKDPVIDELRTLIQDELGSVSYKALTAIHEAGGPTVACMVGWFHKQTRRPTSAAIEAAGRAVGAKRVWIKHKAKP